MNYKIESVSETEIYRIVELIREFAEYEKLSDYCEISEEKLRSALFGKEKVADAITATADGEIIGYAIFYPMFASFRGQRGIFLEDIYIKPEFRGARLGEKMLKHIAKIAKERGFERIDFQVLSWNTSAVEFYKKHGADVNEDDRHFKFSGKAFEKLAS